MRRALPLVFSLLACSSPEGSSQAATTQTTQNSSPPVEVLIRVQSGPFLPTLEALSAYPYLAQWLPDLKAGLVRDLGEAADEIDLGQGTEVLLATSQDAGVFVAFSFLLRSEEAFRQKFHPPSFAQIEPQGHDFAFRPLPGSLLSPLDQPLYLDIADGRLLIVSAPVARERLSLSSPRAEALLEMEVDFAGLWARFGARLQEAYEAEIRKRSIMKEKRAPKQEQAFWEALFALSASTRALHLTLTPSPERLSASLKITPKIPLPSSLPTVNFDGSFPGGSLFGFRVSLPPAALQTLADLRSRFAPPALDSLGAFYPVAGEINGEITWAGGFDEAGLWLLASYQVRDALRARVAVRDYFMTPPDPEMVPLDPGLSFTYGTEGAKAGKGPPEDIIRAQWEKDTSDLALLLGGERLEARYVYLPDRLVVAVGAGGIARLPQFLEAKPEVFSRLPESLLPPSEKKPLGVAWLSHLQSTSASASLSASVEEGALRLDLFVLPQKSHSAD